MITRLLAGCIALCGAVSGAFAQSCNPPSGWVTQFGPISLGNALVLGPACGQMKDGGGIISVTALRGYIGGLGLSNDIGTPNTVIDIAAGSAISDDGTTAMTALTAVTKNVNAAWASGTGNGCLDSGVSLAINTWYHIYEIERTDTTQVDFLCSTNAATPSLPTPYNKQRRIGAVLTDGAAHLLAFKQNGDEFLWATPFTDLNTTVGTGAVLFALTVPTQIKTNALLRVTAGGAAVGSLTLWNSPDEASTAANTPTGNFTTATAVSNSGFPMTLNIRTNTSQQIRVVGSAAGMSITGVTFGWIDTRGRFN